MGLWEWGNFGSQESAVGHKLSNFQPFRLKFGNLDCMNLGTHDFKIRYLHLEK